MDRDAASALDRWMDDPARLPLVVRGARQVGKTWLVRDLAARHGLDLIECNFERDPALARAFVPTHPREILGSLELLLGRAVDPARSLLFLDEVQAAGEALARLRWFAEEMPALPVVAAGSLLEFTLAEHGFAMPVGRITYLHVHPLSFPEFLRAHGQRALGNTLEAWTWAKPPNEVVHTQGRRWFERYVQVGGMPAVVRADAEGAEARAVRRLQSDLLATFIDDFGKYAGRVDPALLVETLRSVARQLGSKFVYASVGEGIRSERARRALELLARAGVCHIVRHSAANGLPLGGEVNARHRKVILLDVGLAHALLRTPATRNYPAWADLAPSVRGGLGEQMLGQQLITLAASWEAPDLYFWQRGGGRPGEVDYLLQVDTRIVPVEAKAGTAGSLKSLHQFVHDKGLDVAVRVDANPPSRQHLDLATTQGDPTRYDLLTLPPYLVCDLPRAVRDAG